MAAAKPWEWTYASIGDSIDVVMELVGNIENTIKKGQIAGTPVEEALRNTIAKARELKADLNDARYDLYVANKVESPPRAEDLAVAPFRDVTSTSV
jgi:hypothetical protein